MTSIKSEIRSFLSTLLLLYTNIIMASFTILSLNKKYLFSEIIVDLLTKEMLLVATIGTIVARIIRGKN
jgi:hypothetical protein